MKYKFLVGGDFHKRMQDISTIRGYVNAYIAVQMDIMNELRDGGYYGFLGLGDWFDKGYGSDVAAALAHTDIDRQMADIVNGNFYGLIGNHIKIRLDSNPELFLIQPHPKYVSRHESLRKEQIIKTPNSLIFNGVQIHFMHWNPMAANAMDYKAMIDKNCHYHIGLYHDECVIPSQYLSGLNMYEHVSDNSMISKCLESINLAIVGHIHKPLGSFVINKNDGTTTTMIVPGSLTNTDAGETSRHEYIDMPVIEIDDDGSVTLSYHRQSLHTELITFVRKEIPNDTREKLKSLRGNSKEKLYEELEQTTFVGEAADFISLNTFMKRQNYTDGDKKMIKSIIANPTDIGKLVEMYNEGKDALC